MSLYTIIGSSGFIGENLVNYLHRKSESVIEVNRSLPPNDMDLGTVVYCAGFGDCREPQKVLDASLSYLLTIVNNCKFDRIFYISSTRLYLDGINGMENSKLLISDTDKRSVFNLTKLMAEHLLRDDPRFISLRLSNVYGNAFKSPLFLPAIIRDAILHGKIKMYADKDYTKDYINVSDVCNAIYELSKINILHHKVYNIASAINVSAESILNELSKYIKFEVDWSPSGVEENYPKINIDRLRGEIEFQPSFVIDDIEGMASLFRRNVSVLQ